MTPSLPPPTATQTSPAAAPPQGPASGGIAQHDRYHYGTLEDVGLVTRLLWFCAGADAQLLVRCPQSDRVKAQGLGGVVATVGVLAFFSGSYAFYTVFSPKETTALGERLVHMPSVALSVFFGLVWAAIIFNIDRFIISSTGKGDGTDRITLQEFTNAQNGEADPQGAGYDPTRVNAPGGTGHPSRILPILQLLLSD